MAWLLEQDGSQFSFTKFEMEPTCRELSPPIEYFKENDLMHLYGRLWWSAVDIEDRFWPKRARMMTARKALPHWVGFCSMWGVSEDFRECVEELEPGVHEYREVEVVRKDGSPFDKRYYAINLRQMVKDAIDWERTTARAVEARGIRILEQPKSEMSGRVISIRKTPIAGLHLWIPQETYRGTCWGMSDALHDLLVKRKLLRGIHSFPVLEVSVPPHSGERTPPSMQTAAPMPAPVMQTDAPAHKEAQ